MAFSICTGTMGGGKSFYAVEQIVKAFERGAHVHTCGVDLVPQVLKDRGWFDRWIDLTPDRTAELDAQQEEMSRWGEERIIPGLEGSENLLVVDEASLVLSSSSQMQGKSKRQGLYQLLIWSRRYGLDVLFVVQHAANVDVQVRRTAGYHIHCTDVSKVPIFGAGWAFFRGRFRRQLLSVKGKVITTSYANLKPAVCEVYDTHGFAGCATPGALAKRQVADKPKSYALHATLAILLAFFGFLGWNIYKLVMRDRVEVRVAGNTKFAEPWSWSTPPVSTSPTPSPQSAGVLQSVVSQPITSVYDLQDYIVTTVSGPTARRRYHTQSGIVVMLGAVTPEGQVLQIDTQYPGCWSVHTHSGKRFVMRKLTQKEKHQIWTSSKSSPLPSSPVSSLGLPLPFSNVPQTAFQPTTN